MLLDVFVTKEDDSNYNVLVYNAIESERSEELTKTHITLFQAQDYVKSLMNSEHKMDFPRFS